MGGEGVMTLAEIAGLILLLAGIAMLFTTKIGYGDPETAKYLISSGLILLGAYYYGYYRGWKALETKVKQRTKKR